MSCVGMEQLRIEAAQMDVAFHRKHKEGGDLVWLHDCIICLHARIRELEEQLARTTP